MPVLRDVGPATIEILGRRLVYSPGIGWDGRRSLLPQMRSAVAWAREVLQRVRSGEVPRDPDHLLDAYIWS